jgi:hypothetical protein
MLSLATMLSHAGGPFVAQVIGWFENCCIHHLIETSATHL